MNGDIRSCSHYDIMTATVATARDKNDGLDVLQRLMYLLLNVNLILHVFNI